jgi:hypothetical protein
VLHEGLEMSENNTHFWRVLLPSLGFKFVNISSKTLQMEEFYIWLDKIYTTHTTGLLRILATDL